MANYSFTDLLNANLKAGFNAAQAAILAAIGLAESGGNSLAHNQHGQTANSLAENSYGVYQINLLAHPEVTVNQATDLQSAANEAKKLFDQAGGNFSPWSTFTSGAYLQYIPGNFPIPNPGSIATSAASDTAKSIISIFPPLQGLLTAPRDLGTRVVGSIFGMVMMGIGFIVMGVSGQRKLTDAALGDNKQAATQGAATGAIFAAASDGGAPPPQASVSEEPSPSPPSPPQRRFAPPPPRGAITQPADTTQVRLKGSSQRADAVRGLKMGVPEATKRATKGNERSATRTVKLSDIKRERGE